MINLKTGQFYGQTNEMMRLEGLTLTDTEYTHEWVDWHYHQNAYFTFIIQGGVLEGNKKETYHCSPGSLLFHNWQEAHYNQKPPGFTRGFQLELEPQWLARFELDINRVEGSLDITDPQLKILFYQLFKASKEADPTRSLAVQSMLVEVISRLIGDEQAVSLNPPAWVKQLRDLLHDMPTENWTLPALAHQVGIHPVHLSRSFSYYFSCNLSHYIRRVRVQHSLALMPQHQRSLTDIALTCGFADQSHFIRIFKELCQDKPSAYRRFLMS